MDWDDIPTTDPKLHEEKKLDISASDTFKCSHCGMVFNYRTTLNAHLRVHGETDTYSCNKCGLKFPWYSALQAHMLEHEYQKGYKCKCGQTFIRYTDLLYHEHPGDFTNELYDRAQEAAEQQQNEQSFRLFATTERRNYFCQYCAKAFSDSRELNNHMLFHRGERAYGSCGAYGRTMRARIID